MAWSGSPKASWYQAQPALLLVNAGADQLRRMGIASLKLNGQRMRRTEPST